MRHSLKKTGDLGRGKKTKMCKISGGGLALAERERVNVYYYFEHFSYLNEILSNF